MLGQPGCLLHIVREQKPAGTGVAKDREEIFRCTPEGVWRCGLDQTARLSARKMDPQCGQVRALRVPGEKKSRAGAGEKGK